MKNSPDNCRYSSEELLKNPTVEIQELIFDYAMISLKNNITEEESDRLEAILHQAEMDSELTLWIILMDKFISEKLDLLSASMHILYESQHETMVKLLTDKIFYPNNKSQIYECKEQDVIISSSSTESADQVRLFSSLYSPSYTAPANPPPKG
jgi:hypothetical protein